MRVMFVTGGRWWNDEDKIARAMFAMQPDLVIEGGAPGADRQSAQVARRNGIQVEEYPADWKRHGKGAGPIRNEKMALRLAELRDAGAEIVCVAFHEDLDQSKGTKDMVQRLEEHGFAYDLVG